MRSSPFLLQLGRHALAALGASLCLAGAAAAREDDDIDPPARVGRIALLVGPVELSREAGAAWDPARVNEPVTAQTALWVPPGSQAEVRIGSSSVRLDGNTQAVFSQLDDHGVAIDVAQGAVRVRLRSLPEGDAFSLAADGLRAEARRTGDFRLDHDPDLRATTLRVRAGELGLVTPRRSLSVEAGQQARVERDGARVELAEIDAADDFDRWADARDREQDRLAATRYVSPEMTGIEDLDAHGRWNVDATLGAVWYPSVLPAGWAPYRYGHWAWVAPWGWTWVDHAPWGFAPFHYGRWAVVGGRWCWVPGRYVARPVWAPALVGFVGGSGFSFSLSVGAPLGWFPLAPYEVYRPVYRHSPRYRQHFHDDGPPRPHRRDTRDDDRREREHRHARDPGALTVMRAEDFRASRPVAPQRLQLGQGELARLQPLDVGAAPALLREAPAPRPRARPAEGWRDERGAQRPPPRREPGAADDRRGPRPLDAAPARDERPGRPDRSEREARVETPRAAPPRLREPVDHRTEPPARPNDERPPTWRQPMQPIQQVQPVQPVAPAQQTQPAPPVRIDPPRAEPLPAPRAAEPARREMAPPRPDLRGRPLAGPDAAPRAQGAAIGGAVQGTPMRSRPPQAQGGGGGGPFGQGGRPERAPRPER